MRVFCWLAQLFRLSVVVDIPTIQSIGHSSANNGRAFVAHFASYSNRRLPGGRPDGVHRWIRSKTYRTPSPRVVLPLAPCIWSHQRCGKHRRCRDRSALGRPCVRDVRARTSAKRGCHGQCLLSLQRLPHVRLALARQVDAQRGGAHPFSKGFASAALQGFVPTLVRDTWPGSVAASRAISVPRRRSASGAMRQLPPTQQRRGGM